MSINKFNSEGYYDPTTYEALTNIEKEERALRAFRPIVYICSPYAGDVTANVENARRYSRFAVDAGYIPIAPHLLFPQFLSDDNPKERQLGLFFGNALMSKCSEVWVFSDSLNLSDTKDKTAAEKLQGYWILEIGELAGLRKAEVETLRSFLSRQNDIYRAAFGRRATPHPRQCIFFGTTNAESGYLRDTTGNRRFWPVKTPGGGIKHSWELTTEDICQIWAEVLVLVESGEKLHLAPDLETLAKNEQREALESDEREGLVREYLETLLPEDWDGMDLFDRRSFLAGVNNIGRVGTVARTRVCNMEIWCELFGKDQGSLGRAESNNLTAMLTKLGWVRKEKKERVKPYGPQFVFVPGDVPD